MKLFPTVDIMLEATEPLQPYRGSVLGYPDPDPLEWALYYGRRYDSHLIDLAGLPEPIDSLPRVIPEMNRGRLS